MKGPACVWAGRCAVTSDPGVLAALQLDWDCGAVVAEVLAAGPVYWHP